MIDVNTLTLGEVAKFEELSGQAITVISDEDRPKGLVLAALAFVWHRRSSPAFTWNDAVGLTIPEAQDILGIGTTSDDEDAVPDAPFVPESVNSGEHESENSLTS